MNTSSKFTSLTVEYLCRRLQLGTLSRPVSSVPAFLKHWPSHGLAGLHWQFPAPPPSGSGRRYLHRQILDATRRESRTETGRAEVQHCTTATVLYGVRLANDRKVSELWHQHM